MSDSQYSLPNTPLMSALSQSPQMNVNTNIIAGPGPRDYWNHSPGASMPMVKEEGSFPLNGNIGVLMKNEVGNVNKCGSVDGQSLPNISGSPNCSGQFTPDMYTSSNTCVDSCAVTYPESYGGKDFGYPEGVPKISNSHQIHAMQNTRASVEGQGPANVLGCYEFTPRISVSGQNNTCALNQQQVYSQVGQWNLLPQYSNVQYSNFPTIGTQQQPTSQPSVQPGNGTMGPN